RLFSALLIGIFALTICSCQKDELKMKVVFYDNQNPGMKTTIDTLVKDSIISLSKSKIDIYFCHNKFHIPYDLPTAGIYKDSTKEKECDMSIYPQNVKCYKYDGQNRVTTMSVNGSGTMGDWNYKYDSKDRITNIEWLGQNFEIKYNDFGLLTDLTEDSGVLKKRLHITYE
ncbi:MAG TPA: hypothetical protein VEW65_06455, partial [Chryseolinea sp.]|nr:hypothetical protein [Chryseolinea sp.]